MQCAGGTRLTSGLGKVQSGGTSHFRTSCSASGSILAIVVLVATHELPSMGHHREAQAAFL